MNKQVEQLNPLYLSENLNPDLLKIAGQKVFRLNLASGRHYRWESGQVDKSLTTFLNAVEPRNKFLEGWRDKMADDLGSADKVDQYVDATADYGTILHILVADYVREGKVDWNYLPIAIMGYLEMIEITGETARIAGEEMLRDFAAICQFFHDYEVNVYAVELPVRMSAGIATCIDLVCEMNEKLYTEKTAPEKRKRIRAVGNLKSGKKGFHKSHVVQLVGERRMFNEMYSGVFGSIDHCFNLAPKDWKESPTYTYSLQTEKANGFEKLFDCYVETAKADGILGTQSRNFAVLSGVTKYGESPEKAITIMGYDQYSEMHILKYSEQ